MNALMERKADSREELHKQVQAIYDAGKAMVADGKLVRLTLAEADEEKLTLRQMRFIHGPILKQISEQVRVGDQGIQYSRKAWKIYLKDLFIPDDYEMVRVPFVRDAKTGQLRPSKREVPRKKYKSLTDLTGKRRSEFIDWVLAYAATEWNVQFVFTFDEREAVRYHAPKRKQKGVEA